MEVTTDGSIWGGIGVLVDITFFDSVVLTGGFAPGLWVEGGGKGLGHVVEFRSQVELGYQFDNRTRLALADRKSVVEGKSGSVRVDLGGRRRLTKKKESIVTI